MQTSEKQAEGEVAEAEPRNEFRARALILDDEVTTVTMLSRLLEARGWETAGASSAEEAEALLGVFEPDVIVADVYLGDEDGLDFVRKFRERNSEGGVIVISAEDTETLASKAEQSGSDYFLSKPIAPTALLLTMQKVLELRRQRGMTLDLRRALHDTVQEQAFPEIVTNCDSMKAVLRLVERVGPRDLAVLVCGESGTGKELIAQAIHDSSERAGGSFVELNCAALPPNLVESELFGHERGAFTGAVASRTGKIEQASGGTLFLDEIGELPLEIQPKLLRALQEKRIVRVGGKESIHCDFRLISATNRDLVEEVRAGRFREDLFYRVAVFPVQIPPLRNRMEDLDLLLLHFLSQEGFRQPHIDDRALRLLHDYDWPGNVRELRNFAQAITLFCDSGVIDRESVRSYFGTRLSLLSRREEEGDSQPTGFERSVRSLARVERDEIEYALGYFEGNVSEASRALGMGRATLYKFIKREDIDVAALVRRALACRRLGDTPIPPVAE